MPRLKKVYRWVLVLDRRLPCVSALKEANRICYIFVRSRVYSIVPRCEKSRLVVAPHCGHLRLCADKNVPIDSGKNQAISQRNKRIDIHYQYVRDVVETGRVMSEHSPTKDMVATPLPKPPDQAKFQNDIKKLV